MRIKLRKKKKNGFVKSWEDIFGLPRPKIAALFGLATGGTHFVLHKMQGHPQILALKQQALFPELKHYFNEGSYPLRNLLEQQLRPQKESLAKLKWIVVNKPQVAYISNQFIYHREQIANLYCFRNPIALYHSRANSSIEYAKNVLNHNLGWEDIAKSIVVDYRVSIASYSQIYTPKLDMVFNLEAFVAQVDEHLIGLWKLLDVAQVKDSELNLLKICEICGRELITREGKAGSRLEKVLYCAHDDLVYVGPGGYNYIRKVRVKNLAAWKNKEHANNLRDYFSEKLGENLIRFFEQEDYLNNDARLVFEKLFERSLEKFRGWSA